MFSRRRPESRETAETSRAPASRRRRRFRSLCMRTMGVSAPAPVPVPPPPLVSASGWSLRAARKNASKTVHPGKGTEARTSCVREPRGGGEASGVGRMQRDEADGRNAWKWIGLDSVRQREGRACGVKSWSVACMRACMHGSCGEAGSVSPHPFHSSLRTQMERVVYVCVMCVCMYM